jgi:transposase
MLTREEFQSLYDLGPDAVYTLVTELEKRVKLLEDRLGKDSHNSSKPPSTDGFNRKPKPVSLRKPSTRKPGGQHGHPGRTLDFADKPDHLLPHLPTQCRCCGTDLEGVAGEPGERRQVCDLPRIAVEITEHRLIGKVCPTCGQANTGEFPEGVVASVQYGPRVRALCVYLSNYQLLPNARITQLFEDVFDAPLCTATVGECVRLAASGLKGVVEAIRDAVAKAPVAYFDETGLRVGGRLHWLHTASTARLTYYTRHTSRGKAGMDAAGVLPRFTGRAMHDGWSPYRQYGCRHSLCNSHHLRELTALHEQQGQEWAKGMRSLLGEIKKAVDVQKERGRSDLHPLVRASYLGRYRKLLKVGYVQNPPAEAVVGRKGRPKQSVGRNLLDRLDHYQDDVLAFMNDFTVPFDNNQAERDVRMTKVKQKVSGGFRTEDGSDFFCCIRSYVSTLRKQGQSILSALESVFRGKPLSPQLPS